MGRTTMTHNIGQQVAALRQLTAGQLRDRYAELFGEPPRSGHREHLVRRIAWRMQARREGDLSERARRRCFCRGSSTRESILAP